jgi:hypothetical protein
MTSTGSTELERFQTLFRLFLDQTSPTATGGDSGVTGGGGMGSTEASFAYTSPPPSTPLHADPPHLSVVVTMTRWSLRPPPTVPATPSPVGPPTTTPTKRPRQDAVTESDPSEKRHRVQQPSNPAAVRADAHPPPLGRVDECRYRQPSNPAAVRADAHPPPLGRVDECRYRAPAFVCTVQLDGRLYVHGRQALSYVGFNPEAHYMLWPRFHAPADARQWLRDTGGGGRAGTNAAYYYDFEYVVLPFLVQCVDRVATARHRAPDMYAAAHTHNARLLHRLANRMAHPAACAQCRSRVPALAALPPGLVPLIVDYVLGPLVGL